MHPLWRVANLIMFVFLSMSTYVQHNDPQPLLWLTIYGVPCIICFVCIFHLKHNHLGRVFLVLCYVTIIYSLITIVLFGFCLRKMYEHDWSFNILKHYEGKDFLGVMIVTLWMSTNVYVFNKEVTYPCKVTTTIKLVIMIASIIPLGLWFLHWLQFI